jgi:2'-5' RNA ligase
MDGTGKTASRRLFFALWPDAAARDALAAWQDPLHALCGGRTMRPDTLHCTLVFLGSVAEQRMEPLLQAARETPARRFELRLGAAHYWGHNRIVYGAPDSTPQALAELVQELEGNLRRHGFRFEERPYRPHVTLLRGAEWRHAPTPVLPEVVWPVRDFVLVQSAGDAQGARYEVLARFAASALE